VDEEEKEEAKCVDDADDGKEKEEGKTEEKEKMEEE